MLWKPLDLVGSFDGFRKPSPAAAPAAFWGISASESEVLTSDSVRSIMKVCDLDVRHCKSTREIDAIKNANLQPRNTAADALAFFGAPQCWSSRLQWTAQMKMDIMSLCDIIDIDTKALKAKKLWKSTSSRNISRLWLGCRGRLPKKPSMKR